MTKSLSLSVELLMLNDLIDIRDALVRASALKPRDDKWNEFDRGYQQGVRCALRKVQALVEKMVEEKKEAPITRPAQAE